MMELLHTLQLLVQTLHRFDEA